jgi:hypothetical protein
MADIGTFDRRGNYYYQGLYPTPSVTEARQKPFLRMRSFENVTPWQRRELINWCWGIYARISNVRGAIHFKTDFACSDGCFVEHRSSNKAWGKSVEEYLNETYYADCNLAGGNHDFHTTLSEVSIALETHGQVGWMFDTDENGKGTGKVKLISATSIGNGMSPESKVGAVFDLGNAAAYLTYWGLGLIGTYGVNYYRIDKGPFAGYFLIDGIIVDRMMTTVGYRVVGFDEDGKPSCADLPVGKMNLIFEPKFTDQIMGYPGLSGIVEAVGTVDDWIYYMGQAMKQSAAWAVTRKSKDGRPSNSNVQYTTVKTPQPDGSTKSRIVAHQLMEAGIVELATNNDEEVVAVPFERPSMGEREFIELVETGFFADLWPRDFIYTAGQGRAAARISVVQARQLVWKRHKTLVKFGKSWIQRKIAHGMNSGDIIRNDNLFDAYNLALSTPAEITVDEGNDLKGDLSMMGRGLTSPDVICSKHGLNVETIEAQIFERRERLMDAAIKLSSKKTDPETGDPIWNPKEILQMWDNLGNANQPIDLSTAADEPPQLSTLDGSPNQPPPDKKKKPAQEIKP